MYKYVCMNKTLCCLVRLMRLLHYIEIFGHIALRCYILMLEAFIPGMPQKYFFLYQKILFCSLRHFFLKQKITLIEKIKVKKINTS